MIDPFRRQRGIDRLHQVLQEHGLIQGRDDEAGPAVMSQNVVSFGVMTPSDRPDIYRCAACLRPLDHRRRKDVPHYGLALSPICGRCVLELPVDRRGDPGGGKRDTEHWATLCFDDKRKFLRAMHGIDPVTGEPVGPLLVRTATMREAGESLTISQEPVTPLRVSGVPRTYWDWKREGGDL